MKLKTFKILIINILVLITLLSITELFLFSFKFNINIHNNIKFQTQKKLFSTENFVYFFDYFGNFYKGSNFEYRYFNKDEFREPAITTKNKKKSIILFGCSFTYGDGLDNEKSLHSILERISNRNIYNLGISGGSPKEILYILKEDQIRKNIVQIQEPIEYVIYIFIADHTSRLYRKTRPYTPIYKPTNNNSNLKLIKNNIFTELMITNKITEKIFDSTFLKGRMNKIFKLYIKEIQNEIKKKFPNSNFIILAYSYKENSDVLIEMQKESDIKIIFIEDLIEEKVINDINYTVEDNIHPNEDAWELIIPALAKELDL